MSEPPLPISVTVTHLANGAATVSVYNAETGAVIHGVTRVEFVATVGQQPRLLLELVPHSVNIEYAADIVSVPRSTNATENDHNRVIDLDNRQRSV